MENASTPALAPVRDGRIHRVCPLDGTPLSPVDVASSEQVGEAVARAKKAQREWSERTLSQREAALMRAARRMLERHAEAIEVVKQETGKNDVDGMFTEGLGPVDNLQGWISVVRKAIGPQQVRLNPIAFPWKRASVSLVARGVVGVIAPWNFPIAGLMRGVYPSLLMGNSVVVKASEYAPRSSEWLIARLAEELPEGLVQVLHGDGSVGQALIDAGIDACVFTGSVATGRKVTVRCAERGIPCSAEMGGKDAAVVLGDCNLPRTVAGITHWALSNAGQSCGAVEIVYVEESIADAFVERLGKAWSQLRVGSGAVGDIDLSPIANGKQLALVEEHVADALKKGAKLVTGGARTGDGYGYRPTVLDRCNDQMKVVADETFGPVVAVCRVRGAAEAIDAVNASRYGLGTSIWSADTDRAERLAERLEVGVVTVNNHAFTGAIAALPWTGTKDTGFGIANSAYALQTFARPKTVVVDTSTAFEPFWLPNNAALMELGKLLADSQLGRLLGAWKLPLLMRQRAQALQAFYR